jgi:hypothetical protein
MLYELVNDSTGYRLKQVDEEGGFTRQGNFYTVRSLCSRLEQLAADDRVDFSTASFDPKAHEKIHKAYEKRLKKATSPV